MFNLEIGKLLNIKKDLENFLLNTIHGSIEIRNDHKNKYIYVHYRDNGKLICEYVDIYSKELYDVILNNNIKVKEVKKKLRNINSELKKLNYHEKTLSNQVKLNIDFAKKNLVDTIYKQSVLEGISTTEVNTKNIIEGGIVNGMTSTDISKILNLKHAWEFILEENVILSDTNYYLLSYINKLVIENFYYNAGVIRSTPVVISGTKWLPPLPIENKIKEDIKQILNKKKNNVDKAIDLLLYVMKSQIFIDGNKRTAVIFANHFLISKGLGLIVIPVELIEEYRKLLINYYEGKDIKKIKNFLKTVCYIEIK